jgi:hypothetical protein
MSMLTRFCAVCKLPIEAERAEGFKETRLCVAHAKEIRPLGGEFYLLARQEMTNKKESFKKNPGGVQTKLVRNQAAIDRLRQEFVDRRFAMSAAKPAVEKFCAEKAGASTAV